MTSGICAICGSSTKYLFIKNAYRLTRCPACALVVMDPQPSPETLTRFYSSESGYHTVYAQEFIDMQRREFTKRIQVAQKYLLSVQTISVFDIGAANGLFLDCAKEAGWETSGVEMNPGTVQQCTEKGHTMAQGSVDYYTFTQVFSVIHMGDVIEHMLDPRAAIVKCREAMPTGGILIVATPNAGALFPRISRVIAKVFHLSWPHALPPAHTFQFSADNLNTLFHQEKFSLLETHFLNTSFMEEMRDTEYFQTIYDHLKHHKGSWQRFARHTFLFGASASIYLPFWILGAIDFAITKNGSHVTAWYQKN
jgi:2-polyprenyl-3-methyl-5-hydroxy-6-metoxy-1,4-benzoquinol methylase